MPYGSGDVTFSGEVGLGDETVKVAEGPERLAAVTALLYFSGTRHRRN
jgi:hypothetical protein